MSDFSEILFHETFDRAPKSAAFAPGRVNLIGEHIDYNGGCVLPLTISEGTDVSIGPSDDDQDHFRSVDQPDRRSRPIDDGPAGNWSDYVTGALQLARARGWVKGGQCVAVASTMPQGSGLSSSASLVVAVLKACVLSGAAEDVTTTIDVAQMAQRVENGFVGVPCGIMDQVAVACGLPRTAIFLDTSTLKYDECQLPDDWSVIVLDSGEQRNLTDGRYVALRYRFENAARRLGAEHLCHYAGDIEGSDLEPELKSAARHAVEEHQRTVAFFDLLKLGDMAGVGELMADSHASMRDLLGNSTNRVDFVVREALAAGALGARMTGAGYGGSIVTVVLREHQERFLDQILAKDIKGGLII